jgi:hypothetical protein
MYVACVVLRLVLFLKLLGESGRAFC